MQKNKKKGFILNELTIAIVLMGVLGGMAIFGYQKYRDNLVSQQTFERLKIVQNAIDEFVKIHGRLPIPAKSVIDSDADYGQEINALNDLCNSAAPNYSEYSTQCFSLSSKNFIYGTLPHKTLGLKEQKLFRDKDGFELTYAVYVDLTHENAFENNVPASEFIIKAQDDSILLDENKMGGVAYMLINAGKKHFVSYNSKDSSKNIICPISDAAIPDDEKRNCRFLDASYDYFILRNKNSSSISSTIAWDSQARLKSLYFRK